jgi:1,4-alpha-glucan branching enzyme
MTIIQEHGVVEFRFFSPCASSVSVTGSFNRWREDALLMQPSGDGWWVATARLSAGTHRFHYVTDGKWFTDFACSGIERNHGGRDSLLTVGSVPIPLLTDAPAPAQFPMQ